MTRKEFVEKIPLTAAAAFALMCNGSCRWNERLEAETYETTSLRTGPLSAPGENVDFIVDLESPEYAVLNTPGSYAFWDQVIIVYTEDKSYIAATKVCSDEWIPRIVWRDGEYYCEAHGATFDRDGLGTTTYNNLGQYGIQTYQTERLGTKLRVFEI